MLYVSYHPVTRSALDREELSGALSNTIRFRFACPRQLSLFSGRLLHEFCPLVSRSDGHMRQGTHSRVRLKQNWTGLLGLCRPVPRSYVALVRSLHTTIETEITALPR